MIEKYEFEDKPKSLNGKCAVCYKENIKQDGKLFECYDGEYFHYYIYVCLHHARIIIIFRNIIKNIGFEEVVEDESIV